MATTTESTGRAPAKYYAGIGARSTPDSIQTLMRRLAMRLGREGWTLRSGGAEGADTAFELGASSVHAPVDIYRPSPTIPAWAYQTVDRYHPRPDRLSNYVRRLHARNAMILEGFSRQNLVRFILCWTPGAKITGGTGQALRIALDYGIPVRNLANPRIHASALAWLDTEITHEHED